MTDPDVASGERGAAPRDEAADAPSSDAPAGYGARLAWERQRAGLGVTDIAAQLRLHPNQVRAIEEENLARLPETPYVRGFIRGYARTLRIDPVPLLSDLNAKLAPVPDPENGDAGSDYAVEQSAARERSSRWVMGIAVAALIVLGLVGWQTTQREVQTQAAPVVPAVLAPVAPVAAPTPAATPAADAVSPPASAEVATRPVTVAEAPAPSKQTEAAPAPALPVAAAPAATAPAATPTGTDATPTLLLRFTGASWVEVTDARGKVLMSQLSTPGAEHALDGDLPLNVLIGDATRTSVEVRGVAFNLLPIMRNNVARFTVK